MGQTPSQSRLGKDLTQSTKKTQIRSGSTYYFKLLLQDVGLFKEQQQQIVPSEG